MRDSQATRHRKSGATWDRAACSAAQFHRHPGDQRQRSDAPGGRPPDPPVLRVAQDRPARRTHPSAHIGFWVHSPLGHFLTYMGSVGLASAVTVASAGRYVSFGPRWPWTSAFWAASALASTAARLPSSATMRAMSSGLMRGPRAGAGHAEDGIIRSREYGLSAGARNQAS